MNIQTAYDKWSDTYDSDDNFTRDLDQAVTKEILMNCRYKSVIEIGCGTGKNTVFLSQIAEKVNAIDFSVSMMEIAKNKVNSANVIFSTGDITKEWIYSDESADLVTCNLVLEHIEKLSFIFSQASRVLIKGGQLFISELHPFRQYQGGKANFKINQDIVAIEAFVHHISDFVNIGKNHNFILEGFQEWWDEQDKNKPPRLVSFLFQK